MTTKSRNSGKTWTKKKRGGNIGMPEALKELSSMGVEVTWENVERKEPPKPTRQLMLADFFDFNC